MMMSVMLLFVSACLWSLSANAQTAQVYGLRLEPNAVDKGRGMLKVHFHFKCVGAKGHKVHPVAYIQADNGKIHTYKDGKQAAWSGYSRVAPYETTVWNGDEWLGFYKDRLTVLPGKHTCVGLRRNVKTLYHQYEKCASRVLHHDGQTVGTIYTVSSVGRICALHPINPNDLWRVLRLWPMLYLWWYRHKP